MNSDISSPLRIFILSNKDLTSSKLFQPIFRVPHAKVVGLAYSTTLTKRKKGLAGAFAVLERTGYAYWLYLVFVGVFFAIFEKRKIRVNFKVSALQPVSLRTTALDAGVPVYEIDSFNSESFRQIVADSKADLVIVRMDQILKPEFLKIPACGVWCAHSSLLPNYRGIAAEFQAMREGKSHVGTTVFEVVPEVDKGPRLGQSSMEVKEGASLFEVIYTNNHKGGELVADLISEFAQTRKIAPRELAPNDGGAYYSWPTPLQVREFCKKRLRFIHVREGFRFICDCVLGPT
jgi:folate-dependent phosphoribosylglycinamide formyltransferase PurN